MMSTSMWNPYQSNIKTPVAVSNASAPNMYANSGVTSPLNRSTGSESSTSSLNSSDSEKLSSSRSINHNSNHSNGFITTAEYDEETRRESSPSSAAEYSLPNQPHMHHSSNQHITHYQTIQNCGRVSTDSESVTNSSDASSTNSPTYRSPTSSYSNYTHPSYANQLSQPSMSNFNATHHQSGYNYFGGVDFQNSYYSSAGSLPIKQEALGKHENNLFDYSNKNYSALNSNNYATINNVEKHTVDDTKQTPPPTSPPNSNISIPMSNITNNSMSGSSFQMHTQNPYAVHAAAAVNSYYSSMNLNPYSHYHHHPQYLNHHGHYAGAYSSAYANREINSSFSPSNPLLNVTAPTIPILNSASANFTSQPRNHIKSENHSAISNAQQNRSTSNISTISDSNITNSYELNSGLLPHLPMNFNLKGNYASNPNIKVKLQDMNLWKQFNQIGTEMIITKCGRRMFPSLRVSVSGLDSSAKYKMLIEIVPVDDNRYKYHNCEWVVSGKAEAHFVGRGYLHPDDALNGNQWMKQLISFHKLKLTNNPFDRSGHIILNSMHKYVPRLHIIEEGKSLTTFFFNEAIFTAVTAYQNELVCFFFTI